MYKLTNIIGLIFLLNFNQTHSQDNTQKGDLIDLIKELIITQKERENLKQVWWLPEVYWELALKDSKYSNQNIIDEIKTTLNGYTVIIITNVTISPFSGFVKKQNEMVKMTINNIDYNYIEDIPSDVNILLQALKPTLAKTLGQLGESMEMYVFDNSHENKISPIEKGSFKIKIDDSNFEFMLPLATLVEKKHCPVDNKPLNGNWIFCPWHGERLN